VSNDFLVGFVICQNLPVDFLVGDGIGTGGFNANDINGGLDFFNLLPCSAAVSDGFPGVIEEGLGSGDGDGVFG